jgi:hypothetical protein
MVGTEGENPQNKQVERALEQVCLGHAALLSYDEGSVGVRLVEVKTDDDRQAEAATAGFRFEPGTKRGSGGGYPSTQLR